MHLVHDDRIVGGLVPAERVISHFCFFTLFLMFYIFAFGVCAIHDDRVV